MKKIVVVGSTNIDFVVRLTEMPKKGDKIPGGKGANQACAVGKLGGNCTFLSAVGNDGVSELALNSLRAANVNIRPILISDDTSTGIAIIAVNDEGENSIMIIPGANSLCDNDYFTAHQLMTFTICSLQQKKPKKSLFSILRPLLTQFRIWFYPTSIF